MEFALRDAYAKKVLEKYKDLNEAYKHIDNYDGLKPSNVPLGVTLDRRTWELTEVDRLQAEVDYRAASSTMTSEEYHRQLDSGEFLVSNFDKSYTYKRCINNYINKKGRVSKAERTELEDESDKMVERVLADTDILLTTASNCGGGLLKDSKSFVPTIIICDEAGQISIPSLCVPLTIFEKWEGVFLFGDPQQLSPTVLSGQFNEFGLNAKKSPPALLELKKFDSYLLDTQYRMCPGCSKFPRDQLYDGRGLKDAESVKVDNDVRKYIRGYTKSRGAKGDKGQGTEYVLANVRGGCSRVEVNGTSLVNHANADAIVDMIGQFLRDGVIRGINIKILTYYQGQRRLLRRKIAQSDWAKADKDAIEISTVDAFQGRESRVVIVDTVAARDRFKAPPPKTDDDDEDEEDVGTEGYIKIGVVTGHVKSAARLNVALTRAQDSTIVVCQTALLSGVAQKKRGKLFNSVTNLVGDTKGRDCIITDLTPDSHPEAVAHRKKLGRNRVNQELAAQATQDLSFIGASKQNWRATRYERAVPPMMTFPLYRTPEGQTTRPIGNPELIAQADAHDEDQKQIAAVQAASQAASLHTAEVEAEDRRTLEAGTQESLGPAATLEEAAGTDAKMAEPVDQDDMDSDASGEFLAEGDEQEEDV